MPTSHKDLTGSDAIHPAGYVQSTDPGAIGPNKSWFDSSLGSPFAHKIRNAANTAWNVVGIQGVLSTVGDLMTTGLTNAVRLAVGNVGDLLQVVQNAASIATPSVAPTLTTPGSPPANTWAASTSYLIGYTWGRSLGGDGSLGQTALSPTTTYASGTSPVAQNVTVPTAPTGTNTLYVYVGLTSTTMYLTNTQANPSLSGSTTVTVTGPNVAGALAPATNTTGGRSPAWGPLALLFGTPGTSNPGDTVLAGTATTPARSDHRHARELFATVISSLTFGGSSAAGTANTDARGDHVHGLPVVFSQSSTVVGIATGGTIATAGITESRVSPTSNVTGVILQVGTYGGQPIWVVNESTAYSVTFAASGTSAVATGASSVIAPSVAKLYVWDSSLSLWFDLSSVSSLSSLFSQSSTSPAIATSGTITTSGITHARVTPTGPVTGVVLQAGTFGGQVVWVTNEAAPAAYTVTFGSSVANNLNAIIPGLSTQLFVWDSSSSLWYAVTPSAMHASGTGHSPGLVPDTGSTIGTGRYLREDAQWFNPFSINGSATVITTGSAIPASTMAVRLAPASAVTGITLGQGIYGGQLLLLINESAAANTITFAAAATSNVADGVSTVIPGLTHRLFVWSNSLYWYEAGAAAVAAATMVASGASHAGGLVPDPGSVAGTLHFLREDATFALLYSQSATAAATATSGTIATAGVTMARVAPTAAITGVILQAGTYGGQEVWVANESAAANTIAFAASGTSNVADGAASTLVGLTAKKYVWDAGTSLWYGASSAASGGGSVFVASGASHASGLVPDPGSVAGTIHFLREDATFALLYNQSATAAATATSGTITTAGVTMARVAPVAAITGAILQAGTYGGQEVWVANESAAAFSVTYAASGTSNVADGASSALAGLTARKYVWDAGTSLWYAASNPSAAVFVASGASHASGDVPDPGSTAGVTRFLREDATWASPSTSSGGGSSGTLVPIQVIGPLAASQATLPFTNIPQNGYRNLRVVLYGRTTAAAVTETIIQMTFNGDTGNNYEGQSFEASAASTAGTDFTARGFISVGRLPGASSAANIVSMSTIEIPNYQGSLFKPIHSHNSHSLTTGASQRRVRMDHGEWLSTAAITSITLTPTSGSFDVGTYACLYGESDSASPLLTPASNVIFETALTAATPTISIPNITQNYRDLVIEIEARSDTASGGLSTACDMGIQINGDTGSNYDWTNDVIYLGGAAGYEGQGVAVGYIAKIPAATAVALSSGVARITIPNYSVVTGFHKSLFASGSLKINTTSSNHYHVTGAVQWRSTAAITSLLLMLPSTAQFVAGTTVRVYGEPATAAGAAVGTGTRLRNSASQSATTATALVVGWDTEDNDADNQHYTSSAALTGTLAKTASSTAVVGTSTLFTTELSVGQVISVPGTATEVAVVTAITDATHLTVANAFANTASGQTATRVNSAVIFRQAGFYSVESTIYSAALASGAITLQFRLNGSTIIDQKDIATAVNASAGYELITQRQFQQWDYVEVLWTHNSGGSVNILADERTHLSITSRPTVIIAVPYINIQDQRAQNTNAGTFTSGSWQTRTLNTVVNDRSSISTLSINQITLPPGTYRVQAHAHALGVNAHQTRLQNITDTATLLTGTSEYADSSGVAATRSIVSGRFTLSGTKVIEFQHQCGTTSSGTSGMGRAANFGTEVYAVVELWKEG